MSAKRQEDGLGWDSGGPQAPDGPRRPSAESLRGPWHHSLTGFWLPRGGLLQYQASDADCERIAQGSERRGVREAGRLQRRIRRAVSEEQQLRELCEWLSGFGLDILGTVTYSDDYAEQHRVYSLKAAMRDVRSGLRHLPMMRGRKQGFAGRFVLAGEWHRSGRIVPHVHLALDSNGAPIEKLCRELWTHFFETRGRCRFEPMRDASEATLYGLKDTVKQSAEHAEALALRLTRTAAHRGKR